MIRPVKREVVGLEVKDSPKKFFPTPSITAQHYITALRSIKERSGHAPTLDDYRKLLRDPSPRISLQDYRFIQAEFITSQRPLLTLDQIRQLHASLRDSITTFRASWRMEYTWNKPVDPLNMKFRTGKYEFWMDSAKLRFDATRGPNFNEPQGSSVRSYDGSVERVFDSISTGKSAVIHPLISVAYYFDRTHPLQVAKLVDSQRDLGKSVGGLENFQNRYAYPLERTVDFLGTQCIPLFEQDTVYYLDPGLNYAYCGMEAGRYVFNAEEGKIVESDTYGIHSLTDMTDCGNGIWLPRRATETRYVRGAVESVLAIDITFVEVNKPLDATVFEQIVPSGVEVFDGTRGVAYVQGRSKSVADTVEHAIIRRPSNLAWTITLANIVVLCAVLVYFFWRLSFRRT